MKMHKYKEISIICACIDLGLLQFIRQISSNKKIKIKAIIVSQTRSVHPKSQEQINNRKIVFNDSKLKLLGMVRKNLVFFLELIGLKKILLYTIVIFYRFRYSFSIVYANDLWEFNRDIYKYISIVYSFEGILSEEIIKKFERGIINIHPAKIPEYRGLDASLWALKDESKLGVSAYLIDKGIDTGKVIKFFELKRKFLSLESYISELKELKYKSYVEAILLYSSGKIENEYPIIKKDQNRGVMPKKTIFGLKNKVQKG